MSDRIWVATRKGVFRMERTGGARGSGWAVVQTSFLGDNATYILSDPRDGAIYAALYHGHFGCKIQRSDDRGETWVECAVPEYPQPPDGASPDVCPMSGREIPWKLKSLTLRRLKVGNCVLIMRIYSTQILLPVLQAVSEINRSIKAWAGLKRCLVNW